jgi:hypothetical protein
MLGAGQIRIAGQIAVSDLDCEAKVIIQVVVAGN